MSRLLCRIGWHRYAVAGHIRRTLLTPGIPSIEHGYSWRVRDCKGCGRRHPKDHKGDVTPSPFLRHDL